MSILIKVISGEEEHTFSTFPHEYRSLMALIQDKLYPDGFGECGGIGRCATCQVELKGATQTLTAMDRNEQTTLSKQGISDPSTRLSCQILIEGGLNNATVVVLQG